MAIKREGGRAVEKKTDTEVYFCLQVHNREADLNTLTSEKGILALSIAEPLGTCYLSFAIST